MPAVTRIGDADITHCSGMVRAVGSQSVFINGRALSFETCINTVHLIPAGKGCANHVGPISTGSSTVKVHGLGVGRIGDALSGCTFCAEGSPNVFSGG